MSVYKAYKGLLNQARKSAKYWILQLCQAFKEEDSNNLSNEDIRDRRVKKDCTSIWQKEDTIRDSLPDTRKEKCDKREWDAKIFSIKPFNNSAVEQFFYTTATGLPWSLIQDENFGFEICGIRLNSDSVAILVEGYLHHYLIGLCCFGSYTKQNRQVHDSHDRWSAVAVVAVAVGRGSKK